MLAFRQQSCNKSISTNISFLKLLFSLSTHVIFFIHKISMNGHSLVGGLEKTSLSLFSLIEKTYGNPPTYPHY